ncbi:CHRD domain-containing protein [Deinococcus cellulosilyticus]|uniref:CHRD domain-containing protein n=1 Tax=Deinococcus cellulosilyticus (strain DSM 18568 / NBRC 106333 / KACC 11606 / 5516J-15) TaxID=1223518 RepID=A0A511N1U1_DEIC1|nr:CHRD domain-containing protein [Deinococcus cellulosilyticus]GEM46477.1 CHRD domain-containing protein [Deinococcus cellulosilyticus NBRC 106333 = KACC 11606]
MQARTLILGVFSLILASCAQQVPAGTSGLFAKLQGSNVVPAVTTDAWGYANATLNGTDLNITGAFYRLSGKATSIELRQAKVGSNGGTVVCTLDIPEASREAKTGSFGKLCTAKDHGIQEDLVKTGNYYITVNTAANPAGEIRGQLGYE